MFGALKNLAGMASMMSQAGDIQGKIAAAKERISRLEESGTAGGDAVRVRMTGEFRVSAIELHPWLIEARNRELSEQLITAAVNEAISRVKEAAAREMASVAKDVPGLEEGLRKMGVL